MSHVAKNIMFGFWNETLTLQGHKDHPHKGSEHLTLLCALLICKIISHQCVHTFCIMNFGLSGGLSASIIDKRKRRFLLLFLPLK